MGQGGGCTTDRGALEQQFAKALWPREDSDLIVNAGRERASQFLCHFYGAGELKMHPVSRSIRRKAIHRNQKLGEEARTPPSSSTRPISLASVPVHACAEKGEQ